MYRLELKEIVTPHWTSLLCICVRVCVFVCLGAAPRPCLCLCVAGVYIYIYIYITWPPTARVENEDIILPLTK